MTVALGAVGVDFLGGSHLHGASAVVAVVALFCYTAGFAIGLGPVFWLLISEIYPVDLRGRAMSVATMANWGSNFVVTLTFLTLLSAVHGFGTFFLFAFLGLASVVYVAVRVPEARGRSLQQVERSMQ